MAQSSSSSTAHAIAENEGPEFMAALEEVYHTLKDPEGPDDAKRDAALRSWSLSEHRNRKTERQRQRIVAVYGDFPHVLGLLLDTLGSTSGEEVQWRISRALVQLAFDNPEVSWSILQNGVKDARRLAKEQEKVLAGLREEQKQDVAGVDAKLRQRIVETKERISHLKARRSSPSIMMSIIDQGQQKSWRVVECMFHALNNMANSCWEAHDLILKDGVLERALPFLADEATPSYVVSSIVGFLCSMSYRFETRKALLEAEVPLALRPIIIADSSDMNSMSAVLAVANIAGPLRPEQCPAVTSELQIPVKIVASLQACLTKQSFGGRYGTIWKVMLAASSLCTNIQYRAGLISNGAPNMFFKILESTTLNPIAEEHCCRCLLYMAFESVTRGMLMKEAPDVAAKLEPVCLNGKSEASRCTAEAALWALTLNSTPRTQNPDTPIKEHIMISYEKAHKKYAECLVTGLKERRYRVQSSDPAGLCNIEGGVRGAIIMLVLLTESYQKWHLCRAEVLAAVELDVSIIWINLQGGELEAPDDWVTKLPDKFKPVKSGPLKVSMENLRYDSVSNSLVPRSESDAFLDGVAKVLGNAGMRAEDEEDSRPQSAALADETALSEAEPTARSDQAPSDKGDKAQDSGATVSGDQNATASESQGKPKPEDVGLATMLDWSVEEVADWIAFSLELPEYRDMFLANAVDGLLLVELEGEDLEHELRVENFEHREKIINALKAIMAKTPGESSS